MTQDIVSPIKQTPEFSRIVFPISVYGAKIP